MEVDCVHLIIKERSDQIFDCFFNGDNNQYHVFMNVIQTSTITGESVFELENALILQTRQAIDFAYKMALNDILRQVDHFDHNMTTQATKTSHMSYEK